MGHPDPLDRPHLEGIRPAGNRRTLRSHRLRQPRRIRQRAGSHQLAASPEWDRSEVVPQLVVPLAVD